MWKRANRDDLRVTMDECNVDGWIKDECVDWLLNGCWNWVNESFNGLTNGFILPNMKLFTVHKKNRAQKDYLLSKGLIYCLLFIKNRILMPVCLFFTIELYDGPIGRHVTISQIEGEGVCMRGEVIIYSADQQAESVSLSVTAHNATQRDKHRWEVVGLPQCDHQRGCYGSPTSIWMGHSDEW